MPVRVADPRGVAKQRNSLSVREKWQVEIRASGSFDEVPCAIHLDAVRHVARVLLVKYHEDRPGGPEIFLGISIYARAGQHGKAAYAKQPRQA